MKVKEIQFCSPSSDLGCYFCSLFRLNIEVIKWMISSIHPRIFRAFCFFCSFIFFEVLGLEGLDYLEILENKSSIKIPAHIIAGAHFCPFTRLYDAVAVQVRRQVAMTYDFGVGIELMQLAQKGVQRLALCQRSCVGRHQFSVVHTAHHATDIGYVDARLIVSLGTVDHLGVGRQQMRFALCVDQAMITGIFPSTRFPSVFDRRYSRGADRCGAVYHDIFDSSGFHDFLIE